MLCLYESQTAITGVLDTDNPFGISIRPTIDYYLKGVELSCYWDGAASTVTMSLYSVDPDGLPLELVATQEYDTDDLPATTARFLFEFDTAVLVRQAYGDMYSYAVVFTPAVTGLHVSHGDSYDYPVFVENDGGWAFDEDTPLYFYLWGEPQATTTTGMYTLFEHYQRNDNSTAPAYGDYQLCQTFTPSTTHMLRYIQLNMIRVLNPYEITISLYLADEDTHKPTGTALTSVTYSQEDMPTGEAANESVVFPSPVLLSKGVEYAIVMSVPQGNIASYYGWRANSGGVAAYNGTAFSSEDGGTTWAEAIGYSMLFSCYGTRAMAGGNHVPVHLIPAGEGNYTELAAGKKYYTNPPNWLCVATPPGTADDLSSGVAFSFRHDHFVSGYLTGTSIWRSGVASLECAIHDPADGGAGHDTAYTDELEEGYFVRDDMGRWIGRVKSIQNDYALTLEQAPKGGSALSRDACAYYNPRYGGYGDPPAFKLTQTSVTFTRQEYVITGVDTQFLTELWPNDYIRYSETYRGGLRIKTVDSDTQLTLYERCPHKTVETTDAHAYSATHRDADGATAYCKPVKRDSYTVKSTLVPHNIQALEVVFRVGAYSFFGGATTPETTGYLTGEITWGFGIIRYNALGFPYVDPSYYIQGSGSSFTTELKTGDYIWRPAYPDMVMRVDKIESDTFAVLKPSNFIEAGEYLTSGTDADGTVPVCATDPSVLSPQTCYATPFIRLNSVDVEGTPIPITPQALYNGWDDISATTYRQLFTRPQGGEWMLDDMTDIEVGIILEAPAEAIYDDLAVDNYPFIYCSRLYIELDTVVSPSDRMTGTGGITERGWHVRDIDGTVGIDQEGFVVMYGYNQLGHIVMTIPSGSDILGGRLLLVSDRKVPFIDVYPAQRQDTYTYRGGISVL